MKEKLREAIDHARYLFNLDGVIGVDIQTEIDFMMRTDKFFEVFSEEDYSIENDGDMDYPYRANVYIDDIEFFTIMTKKEYREVLGEKTPVCEECGEKMYPEFNFCPICGGEQQRGER